MMKNLKTLTTAVTMTLAMGIANLSYANPTTTTTATTTATSTTSPVATTATTKTTVKKTPHKTTVKKVTTSKTGFKCKDGSLSKAKSTRGACSGHGGIAR